MIQPVPLTDVEEEQRFGGKAVALGRALRAGLPVPPGFGLSCEMVDGIARSDRRPMLAETLEALGGRAAVRSSAVGEDARDASFAGQHLTVLNATTPEALTDSILQVHQSAHSASALAYRERIGIPGPPRIAVVLQRLIDADAAGVLFTRNPATGAHERVIEAAWGLGEAVVSGVVVPDSYRLDESGRVLERTAGDKNVELRLAGNGGTVEVALDASRARAFVLDDSHLVQLHDLTLGCEDAFGPGLDIEWAFEGGRLFLLQCRSITRDGS